MFAFIDESYKPVSGSDGVHFTTYASVLVRREECREFARELFNLKKQFWPKTPMDHELKGRILLGKRGLQNPDYRRLITEVLSLMRSHSLKPFAVTNKGKLGPLQSQRHYFPIQLQFLLERVNNYTALVANDSLAIPVLDTVEDKANRTVSEAMSNSLFRSQFGQSFEHLIDFATFGDSRTTPGIQVADVVAYCANTYYATRDSGVDPQLERVFNSLRDMTHNWICGGTVKDWGFRYMENAGT